jgi:3-deoxy-D-manno-octulosonic-acid transferase
VGEAGSAAVIIRAWRAQDPEAEFLLSVGTPAGREHAEKLLGDLDGVQFMAPPVDVWGAPGRTLARVEPRALVIIETEIWPGLLRAARRRKVPVVLAAGRVSERTARRYAWVKSFFRQLLNSMERLIVISEADRDRFLSLGVDTDRIEVKGSPKFDGLIARAQGPAPPPISNRPPYLLVAGSTHPGEEELLLSEILKALLGRALDESHRKPAPDAWALGSDGSTVGAWKEADAEAEALAGPVDLRSAPADTLPSPAAAPDPPARGRPAEPREGQAADAR